jgi:hypothetical protein
MGVDDGRLHGFQVDDPELSFGYAGEKEITGAKHGYSVRVR